MASSRLTRALKLLDLLQSGHGVSVEHLARALGCSRRTIFRDIRLLNDNDIRVWFDESLGGYTSHFQLWALVASMDEDELIGLLVAAMISPLTQLEPCAGIVNQAVAKMMARASRESRDRVERLVRAIVVRPIQPELEGGSREVFGKLLQAIATRKKVRVRWTLPDTASSRWTLLSPFQLVAGDDQWTVVGHSTLHKEAVTIPLQAISRTNRTRESYEVPSEHLRGGQAGTTFGGPASGPLGAIPSAPASSPREGPRSTR